MYTAVRILYITYTSVKGRHLYVHILGFFKMYTKVPLRDGWNTAYPNICTYEYDTGMCYTNTTAAITACEPQTPFTYVQYSYLRIWNIHCITVPTCLRQFRPPTSLSLYCIRYVSV